MIIRQLGSSIGNQEIRQHLTTFLVNDSIAIDAGCLGLLSPIERQRHVQHVLLSHSHIDHIATLPFFLDTVFEPGEKCPTVYASRTVWESLKSDVLNERLWPDLSRIESEENRIYGEQVLLDGVPVHIDGVTITPVAVDHVVPTFGFLIEDQNAAVVFSADTGPTTRLWELANRPAFRSKLKIVFLECSFPQSHEWLANNSGHLSSNLFAKEMKKVSTGSPFFTVAIHLKGSMYDQTSSELMSIGIPGLSIGGGDRTWAV